MASCALLLIGGLLSLLFAAFHDFFPQIFQWEESLSGGAMNAEERLQAAIGSGEASLLGAPDRRSRSGRS